MRRNSTRDDINKENTIGEPYLESIIGALRKEAVVERAPNREFPDWDIKWESFTDELKNDYLGMLTTNIAVEDKCLKNSKADIWHYGAPHIPIIQKQLTSLYWSISGAAKNGEVDLVKEGGKKLLSLIKENIHNIIYDIYEWERPVLQNLATNSGYKLIPSGDNGRAWCYVVPKKDIEDAKIESISNVSEEFVSLVYEKMQQEMNKQLERAKKESKKSRKTGYSWSQGW